MSIFVTITLHTLTYYAYLLTITIVIYLVLSFVLSIDQHPSGTYNYLLLHIYFVYILWNNYRIILYHLQKARRVTCVRFGVLCYVFDHASSSRISCIAPGHTVRGSRNRCPHRYHILNIHHGTDPISLPCLECLGNAPDAIKVVTFVILSHVPAVVGLLQFWKKCHIFNFNIVILKEW